MLHDAAHESRAHQQQQPPIKPISSSPEQVSRVRAPAPEAEAAAREIGAAVAGHDSILSEAAQKVEEQRCSGQVASSSLVCFSATAASQSNVKFCRRAEREAARRDFNGDEQASDHTKRERERRPADERLLSRRCVARKCVAQRGEQRRRDEKRGED